MTTATKRLVLRKNQDRRVRGGHPWIFSNEVATLEGAPAPGDLVEVADVRGAFLGRAYYNPQSLICARLVTRKRDEVDADLFVKRMERARAAARSGAAGRAHPARGLRRVRLPPRAGRGPLRRPPRRPGAHARHGAQAGPGARGARARVRAARGRARGRLAAAHARGPAARARRLVGRGAGARRGRARGLPGRGRPAARAEDRALPRPAAEPARRRVARRRPAGARPLLLPGGVVAARRARGRGLGAGGGLLRAGAGRCRAQPRAQRPAGPRGPAGAATSSTCCASSSGRGSASGS